ncbi:dihydropteroate synthase [Tessaracoccus rhinocerotis]|uniref:Dihydropteroate synthase n=1 Tax=Tessaracoccus rhinocerotis TaxID=1689449 RepID=A0A553K1I5_9ACTN|nr:dihydropteroate synthase [Tessaracoccus rhinocerotis]TRY18562.1 dihydropteroate synthase [Tessaracoccus rhinocerotis]
MTLVMGVVNVTTDSFSDGGRYVDTDAAVAHGLELASQGAEIVDVGGESTRPGAQRVDAEDELARVVPVVRELAGRGITVSVDTMRARVAEAAIAAGAAVINDVSGGLADADMLDVVASSGVDYVLMHWRSHSETMQSDTAYDDVLADVVAELVVRRDAALRAGIPGERIVLDPGVGFSKTWDQNWDLLAGLERFEALGHRILVGVSRKRFLGELLGGREPLGRDAATAAISTWCALADVWAVRTHEVPSQLDAIRVGQRLRAARLARSGGVGPQPGPVTA